jgi:hypothetical protein
MRVSTLLISTILFCSVGLFAQDDLAQYQTMMKAAAGANGALRKAIAASDNAATTENANKVAAAFDGINKFWVGKNNTAAATFAATARDAAKAVAGGDASAAAKIGGTCGGCHAITRDGNKFKM